MTQPSAEPILFLSTIRPNRGQWQMALGVMAVSVVFFLTTASSAKMPLPQVWAFLPVYQSAYVVITLITAVMLLGQFRLVRSRALLFLTGGYLFDALMAIAHILSFPGLFAPGGLFGAGPQTTAWLYFLWHGGFPLFVIAYAMFKGGDRDAVPAGRGISGLVLAVVTGVAALAFGLVALSYSDALLPAIMQGQMDTPRKLSIAIVTWLLCLAALALLAARRPYSLLDLWLMVSVGVWVFDVALAAVFNGGRFDLGWYTGRVYGLLASSFVLVILLLENSSLYQQLLRLRDEEKRLGITQLRASEEKYRALFTNMADGFVLGEPVFDIGGKVVDLRYLEVNEAFYAHTGIPRGITERTLREHLPQIEQQWIDRYGAVALTGVADEFQMYNADTDRHYHVHAFSPGPGRFAVMFRDITDRKQAEKEREQLFAELESRVEARTSELRAANQELEGFTFATSHDLKGPLGRINSFAELLQKNYRDRLEGDGLLFLDLIRQNAVRLTRLVEDLLGYSRISQQRLELQDVELDQSVQAIVREKVGNPQAGGAEIRIDLPAVRVLADVLALQQALGNLVENAIKYSAQAEQPQVDIGGEVLDSCIRLWIRDNGIGFDMKYHDQIFEIFKRLHTQSEYVGSGIGLALVKRAVERMGGKVWAESTPGQGATFFVELRLAI